MQSLACVIGDLSLIRALGRAGIPVALVTSDTTSSATRSRYCAAVVETPSFVDAPEAAVAALLAFGATQSRMPVLFPQGDHDLVAVSRHRDVLATHFRFALPRAELVEALVDKRRFAELATRRGLPVPRTLVIDRHRVSAESFASWEVFPTVLKPAMRTHWFGSRIHELAAAGNQKVVFVSRRDDLLALVPSLEDYGTDFLLQEAIPGGEDHIVSYHAYVRPDGRVAGEFTGRKVRTAPRTYGMSSCVEITDSPEVKQLGRAIVAQLSFTGVVKLDFKEHADSGRLYLLEANPRFNLWHHPAALAGVNIPALVYADLVGTPGAAPAPRVRPGVRWMTARDDFAAMREYRAAGELSVGRWLLQLASADIREDLSLVDPVPTLRDAIFTISRHTLALSEKIGARISHAVSPS